MANFPVRALSSALLFAHLLGGALARAEYAAPPESPYRPESRYRGDSNTRSDDWNTRYVEPSDSWLRPGQPSTLRFHVGPALLAQPTSPGLFTALDLGQGAVGGRVSAAWLRAESDEGLSAYTAELWIDFRHRYTLHPVLGAGAGFLRGGALDGEEDSAGAGVLRGALEYELPVSDADARLGLNVLLLVPAIGTERTRPWTSAALTIGAGF
jgi:hypothetical protein